MPASAFGLARPRAVQGWLVLSSLVGHVALALAGGLWFETRAVVGVSATLFLCSAARLLVVRECDAPVARSLAILQQVFFTYWAATLIALPLLVALALITRLGGLASSTLGSSREGYRVAVALSYAAALVVAGWGVWGCRRWVRLTRSELRFAQLPRWLDGYRIVHLTDLHIGSLDSKRIGQRWVELTNLTRPNLVVVTGDLVTRGVLFYRDVAEILGRIAAPDGVFVCLGNHDRSDPEALAEALACAGPKVLRNESHVLERDGQQLWVAGLEAAGREATGRALKRALGHRPTGAFTLLLSHYPDSFDEACTHGVDLTLSGHTHGGQVGMPLFGDRLNLASLTGQRPRGLVTRGRCKLYVSAGLGTTGIPLRLGVRPEIALLELRAAE